LIQKIVPLERLIFLDSNVDENERRGEGAAEFCLRVAKSKANNAWNEFRDSHGDIGAVVGADTVVYFEGRIIGQPKNNADAMSILKRLSGRCHEVITGVAVFFPESGDFVSFTVRSKVWMHELSSEAIADYVATGEPMDKAGAYAIQGMGKRLVARYEGSYSNIVGLPLDELKKALNFLL
jgi:septum formation protein